MTKLKRRSLESLFEFADFFGGPIGEDGFAVDEVAAYGSEVAAVAAHVAVVSHDEKRIYGDDDFRHGACVGILIGNVGFGEAAGVDVNASKADLHVVAGDSDDALDVALAGIVGVTEDDDVSAIDALVTVNELVDEDAFLVAESGHHARAFDLYGLVDEDNDESGNGERDDEIAQP